MSKKTENDIEWVYVYMDTCGPCRRLSPIIETILATNAVSLKTYLYQDAPVSLQRLGTPCLARYSHQEDKVHGKSFGGGFWTGFFDIYENHNYLLSKKHISPIKFMVNILKSIDSPEKTYSKME